MEQQRRLDLNAAIVSVFREPEFRVKVCTFITLRSTSASKHIQSTDPAVAAHYFEKKLFLLGFIRYYRFIGQHMSLPPMDNGFNTFLIMKGTPAIVPPMGI